jgi:hypothetical protein
MVRRASPVLAPAGEAKPEPTFLVEALGLEESPVRRSGCLQNSSTGNTRGTTPTARIAVSTPTVWPTKGRETSTTLCWKIVHGSVLTKGGLDLKGGRWYSIAGSEQVPAIKRRLLSVPYLMNFTPFAFFGVSSTFRLTYQVNLSNGTIKSWDRWIDRSRKWGCMGGPVDTSRDTRSVLATTFASLTDRLPQITPADSPFFSTPWPGDGTQSTGTAFAIVSRPS